MKKLISRLVLLALALLIIGEGLVRATGMVDFPLYGRDQSLGYWVLPNQQGAFMNKNRWTFNNLGMPVAQDFKPGPAVDIPLIGNSIIMGGNGYDQSEKVTPQMQARLGSGYQIWPVAVGGWTNVNQTVYLQRHPAVVKHADYFVWEVMYGGLGEPATWRSDYVFPTQAPTSALWYAFRRYVLPKVVNLNMNELPPRSAVNGQHLDAMQQQIEQLASATRRKQPGILFLYPDRAQLIKARQGKAWLPERSAIEQLARANNLDVLDLAADPRWTPELYKEGTHPTVDGNRVISEILTERIVQNLTKPNASLTAP